MDAYGNLADLFFRAVQTQVARHAEGILRGQFRQKAAFPLQNGSFFVMDDYISSGQRKIEGRVRVMDSCRIGDP